MPEGNIEPRDPTARRLTPEPVDRINFGPK